MLGRGISSLIPAIRPNSIESDSTAKESEVEKGGSLQAGPYQVSTSMIRVNPRQPRRHFSSAALNELVQSISRAGILQPLIVRKSDTGYELIAGERRLRAAKKLGLRQVPIIVRSGTDQEQLEIALIENLQREDLNPIEEARGYERLAREFSLTQEEIAKRVGKERSTVSNVLRLLKLSPLVQEMIENASISMGHARALLPLEDHRRQEILARKIEKQGLSVRQVEMQIRQMLKQPKHKTRRATDQVSQSSNLRHVAEEFQRKLGTRVEIHSRGKGGVIRIQYYSPEDFQRIHDQLLG